MSMRPDVVNAVPYYEQDTNGNVVSSGIELYRNRKDAENEFNWHMMRGDPCDVFYGLHIHGDSMEEESAIKHLEQFTVRVAVLTVPERMDSWCCEFRFMDSTGPGVFDDSIFHVEVTGDLKDICASSERWTMVIVDQQISALELDQMMDSGKSDDIRFSYEVEFPLLDEQ